jgi:hypothetical protein
VDSIVTKNTMDYPILMESFVEPLVVKMLTKYKISRQLFNKTLKELNSNGYIEYGPLNDLVIEMVFSQHFGGSRGICYLRSLHMDKLIIVMQLILAQEGYKHLPHALTAQIGISDNHDLDDDTRKLERGWYLSQRYLNYKSKFLAGSYAPKFMDEVLGERMSELITTIITNKLIYNTPASVRNIMNDNTIPNNGAELKLSLDYFDELCKCLDGILDNLTDDGFEDE